MPNLQLFNFEGQEVRFVGTADRPEWAALDVVSILHPHSSPNNRVNYLRSIPEKWKGHKKIMTPGGEQEVVTLLEPGLYRMLARTNSPIAEPFQNWLFEEVLPAIRKQGFYLSPDATAAQLEKLHQELRRLYKSRRVEIEPHSKGNRLTVWRNGEKEYQTILADGVKQSMVNPQILIYRSGSKRWSIDIDSPLKEAYTAFMSYCHKAGKWEWGELELENWIKVNFPHDLEPK